MRLLVAAAILSGMSVAVHHADPHEFHVRETATQFAGQFAGANR